MVNCNSYVFRRSDNSNKLTKPGNVAPVWLPAAEAGQDLLSNSEYHAAENMACHKILQIPPLPFIGAGTKCKWLKMGFFMIQMSILVSGLTVCFCDKCISSICLCLGRIQKLFDDALCPWLVWVWSEFLPGVDHIPGPDHKMGRGQSGQTQYCAQWPSIITTATR